MPISLFSYQPLFALGFWRQPRIPLPPGNQERAPKPSSPGMVNGEQEERQSRSDITQMSP